MRRYTLFVRAPRSAGETTSEGAAASGAFPRKAATAGPDAIGRGSAGVTTAARSSRPSRSERKGRHVGTARGATALRSRSEER